MEETRSGKYGRFLGVFISNYIKNFILLSKQESYKTLLVKELKGYSFESRQKGTPKNSGCIWELVDISDPDYQNPIHLAKTLREGIHLMYQKQTQKKVLDSLLSELS